VDFFEPLMKADFVWGQCSVISAEYSADWNDARLQ